MGLTFPCEIISWHVLPAVRREIAKYLVFEKNTPRKTVAQKLGLTEAAICQYIKHKRGGNYQFKEGDLTKIRKMADLMMQSEKGFDRMCVVCKEFDAAQEMLEDRKSTRLNSSH